MKTVSKNLFAIFGCLVILANVGCDNKVTGTTYAAQHGLPQFSVGETVSLSAVTTSGEIEYFLVMSRDCYANSGWKYVCKNTNGSRTILQAELESVKKETVSKVRNSNTELPSNSLDNKIILKEISGKWHLVVTSISNDVKVTPLDGQKQYSIVGSIVEE